MCITNLKYKDQFCKLIFCCLSWKLLFPAELFQNIRPWSNWRRKRKECRKSLCPSGLKTELLMWGIDRWGRQDLVSCATNIPQEHYTAGSLTNKHRLQLKCHFPHTSRKTRTSLQTWVKVRRKIIFLSHILGLRFKCY